MRSIRLIFKIISLTSLIRNTSLGVQGWKEATSEKDDSGFLQRSSQEGDEKGSGLAVTLKVDSAGVVDGLDV